MVLLILEASILALTSLLVAFQICSYLLTSPPESCYSFGSIYDNDAVAFNRLEA